jgi:hypothetical protein
LIPYCKGPKPRLRSAVKFAVDCAVFALNVIAAVWQVVEGGSGGGVGVDMLEEGHVDNRRVFKNSEDRQVVCEPKVPTEFIFVSCREKLNQSPKAAKI